MNPLNILVVDDSIMVIKKLELVIQSMGHNLVATAKTGEEAIEKYRQFNPDVVTMDITMPGKHNGIEATRLIINEFPDANIIMATSHGQEVMVRDALRAGAHGYMLKPVSEEKLDTQLKRIFEL